jgi:hypothetical protein
MTTEKTLMRNKVGARFRSAVCDTEVVVVRAAEDAIELCCGGAPMLDLRAPRSAGAGAVDDAADGGTQVGKRYIDPDTGVELLCTKAGKGSLAVGGRLMEIKVAKPLPATD